MKMLQNVCIASNELSHPFTSLHLSSESAGNISFASSGTFIDKIYQNINYVLFSKFN